MKKWHLVLSLLITSSSIYGQDFIVKNFTADYFLSSDGYFDVVENYDVEFQAQKHGIFRDIITRYEMKFPGKDSTEKRQIYISNVDVPGHKFKVSRGFSKRTSRKVEIKIGDKNKYVEGHQHYEISYRVENAFIFDDNQAKFYWNVKPDDWNTTFGNIKFRVHVPKEVELSSENCFIYDNYISPETIKDAYDLSYDDGVFTVTKTDNSQFPQSRVLTTLVIVPDTYIKRVDYTVPWWRKYAWIGILGIILYYFWHLWNRYGKDDHVAATTSYYAPEGIDPSMAGFLLKDYGTSTHLIALLPQWGAQGILKMEETSTGWILKSKDTKLTRLKSLPPEAPNYGRIIFDGLFSDSDEVYISSLKNKFYKTMESAQRLLKHEAQTYYVKHAERLRVRVAVIAWIMVVVGPLIILKMWGVVAAVVTGLVFIFIALMSFYLKKKNQHGTRIYSELLGFQEFIRVAELPQIEMLLKDDPEYFEKTMGYAVAFDLLKKWAHKFDNLNVRPPEWYSSTTGVVTMTSFSDSFSRSISETQSMMTSSPSSSSSGGGGSAGGGFGGGGGGSW